MQMELHLRGQPQKKDKYPVLFKHQCFNHTMLSLPKRIHLKTATITGQVPSHSRL